MTIEPPITAYLRLPYSGVEALSTRWPTNDPAAAQQLVRDGLAGQGSGRIHLPIAVRQAGETGLVVIVVHRHTVLTVMRIIRVTDHDLDVHPDEILQTHLVGTTVRLRSHAAVQIWPFHCLDSASAALKQPAPPDRRRRRRFDTETLTVTYQAVKASMDAPPTW